MHMFQRARLEGKQNTMANPIIEILNGNRVGTGRSLRSDRWRDRCLRAAGKRRLAIFSRSSANRCNTLHRFTISDANALRTSDWETPNWRAIRDGVIPALNEARIAFT